MESELFCGFWAMIETGVFWMLSLLSSLHILFFQSFDFECFSDECFKKFLAMNKLFLRWMNGAITAGEFW